MPSADRDTLERIRSISGVSDVCARATAELESTLPGEPTLNVTAYDGPMRINQPLVVEGEALSQTDSRGCLIQAGFAEVHGLSVGDRVSVKLSGQEYGFVVRGVVYSPEFICVTDGVYPNPDQYGYILINTCGMPDLPMTQVLVKLADGVDAQQAEKAITAALPAALVVNRGAHQSTANAQSNADMFANLTLVFPLIAYAVAALIVMTTLTRMIENQRMQLGTLKALGYPSRRIRGHYLSYAVWALADRLASGGGGGARAFAQRDLGTAAGTERVPLQAVSIHLMGSMGHGGAHRGNERADLPLHLPEKRAGNHWPTCCGPSRPRRGGASSWSAWDFCGGALTSTPR